MDRYTELGVEIESTSEALEAALARASSEKRQLSQHERVSVASMTARLKSLQVERTEHERQLAQDRGEARAVAADEPGLLVRPTGPTYAAMFGTPKASPFKAPVDFFKAIHAGATTGAYDPVLSTLSAMSGATGSGGGFAVPDELSATWLDTGLESEVVRPRAQVFPMSSDSLNIPGWDDPTHATGSIAGFKTSWLAELGTLVDTSGTLRKVTLKASKGIVSTQLSNELLADGGQSFTTALEEKMASAVSFTMDDAFLNGTGAGMPLGVLNDPALITISKEVGQVAGTFVLENALSMYSRLHPGGYKNAVWVCNHSVIPALYQLVLKVKNVAGTENVGGSMPPYFTVGADGSMRLLNLPVVVTEKLPVLGTKSDMLLADLSQYACGLRQDVTLEASRHAGWSTDSTFYRAVIRVAGIGLWKGTLTSKAGPARSWAIVVETR